ncbi:MAG: hypothetical protein CK425_12420 [Parachlamydia sp.]|nr:MAG: hypothetical protein CK425_12420 [Parachlamydia sp.]
MKKMLSLMYLLSFFLMSCETQNYQNGEDRSSRGQVVNDLLYRIENSFEKKYKINAIATNISMPGGVVKLLGLDFQMLGPLSKEEIRKILITLSEEFLVFVNSDEAIKPYLKNYPFRIENIGITLFFIDSQRMDLDDPYIGIAEISRGFLEYKILITIDDIPSFKSTSKESYEEALEALNRKEI